MWASRFDAIRPLLGIVYIWTKKFLSPVDAKIWCAKVRKSPWWLWALRKKAKTSVMEGAQSKFSARKRMKQGLFCYTMYSTPSLLEITNVARRIGIGIISGKVGLRYRIMKAFHWAATAAASHMLWQVGTTGPGSRPYSSTFVQHQNIHDVTPHSHY